MKLIQLILNFNHEFSEEKGKLEEMTTLISDDSSDSLLKLFNENGKDEGHESKKNNSKGELNDLDKHNIFIELKAEIEHHKGILNWFKDIFFLVFFWLVA